MTDNRPEPQKTGPLFADNCDYRAISTKGEHVALRQATYRASLAEVKCSQLLAGRLTDAERVAIMWALATLETEAADDAGQNAEAAATLRGLLERIGGGR